MPVPGVGSSSVNQDVRRHVNAPESERLDDSSTGRGYGERWPVALTYSDIGI